MTIWPPAPQKIVQAIFPHYNLAQKVSYLEDLKKYVFVSNWQGLSCKQISWPPGIGGLQDVGLDPGQHDYHPHGVVHVGQQQDV